MKHQALLELRRLEEAMPANVPHFIQGFFAQELETLGVRMMPIEGAVAVVDTVNTTRMFGGLVYPLGDVWEGQMHDAYGTSVLENVILTDDAASFDKLYRDHRDVIHYTFRREGDLWTGRFSGLVVGEGPAVCLITPLPAEML